MSKQINVLFEASVLTNGLLMAPARSGIYFVAYNVLIEMLKRDNLKLKFFCSPDKKHLVKKLINSDENLKNISFIEYSNSDKLIEYFEILKYNNKVNKSNKILRVLIKAALNMFKTLSRLLCKLNFQEYKKKLKEFDIFFSPFDLVPYQLKGLKIRKYMILYDIIPMVFPENYPDLKDKKSWFYKLVHSINKDDFYFAISEHTRGDFIKNVKNITPEHVFTIPLSTGLEYERVQEKTKINKVKEKYNILPDKKYLFSLCTLEPRKNLIFAVKNFIEFIKRNNIDDFVFVLGGGYWDVFIQKINEAIRDLEKYKDKIIKIGYVDDEDLPALYSGAEMFVFPSVYEGFGMPVLEAMKCGCPVICSNVTSVPEVIGDCGIQINPENDEELIKAYEKMYYDEEFRQSCIKRGLERAEQFSWEKCVDVIVAIIQAT
ncbi:MAG: glycosyltransferase family 1 protein [Candidatus Gastranaerophilales bacterium]|nr:glycosyltransferase family 1 protein [Candidatus Gastranaerophilales bacterium]